MWNLRALSTLLILSSLYGLFCVALKLPDQDVLAPEEKTCSGESCPEDESSNIDFMSDFLDLDPLSLKKNEINEGETMPIGEFLEVTDHESVSREKNEKEVGNADGEKVEITTDGPKDIILKKLLKNVGQQKPNKLQGPSLIARYVQGVRGAVASSNGVGKIEEKKKLDDTTKVKEAKEEMHEHENIDFMSDFLDMEPLSMKKNEGADLLTEDSFENVTDDQGSMVNLTENQDTHLDFMADFPDEDHMDVQLNQSEDSDNVTDTAHVGMQTNVSDISANDTLSIDDNVTESSVNDTVDTTKDQDEKQIDFLANLLEEDLLENVSESESIESKSDAAEMKGKNEETNKSTGDDNELDFVTDFLSSDPFDTEAIDRSDAVEINAVQEENLDFLTDFLSEDPPSVQSHPDEEIPQDILELYSEDEVVPEQEEVYKRKKPISSNVVSSNVEWAKEEAKKEPSSVWNWFGF